jgi:hypothetical protein
MPSERYHNIISGVVRGHLVLLPYSILEPHEWAKLNGEPEDMRGYAEYCETEANIRYDLVKQMETLCR